jgi:hypothetical protein
MFYASPFFTSYSDHSSTLDTSLLAMEYDILTGFSVVWENIEDTGHCKQEG